MGSRLALKEKEVAESLEKVSKKEKEAEESRQKQKFAEVILFDKKLRKIDKKLKNWEKLTKNWGNRGRSFARERGYGGRRCWGDFKINFLKFQILKI